MSYKVGDTVQLKSGGPKMTVTREQGELNKSVGCVWFAGAKREFADFPPDAIDHVKEPVKK